MKREGQLWIKIFPDKPITKKPLRDLKFPKNSIIGAINREDEVVLASGDSHVRAGEPVVVFCHEDAVPQIEKLFTRRKLL